MRKLAASFLVFTAALALHAQRMAMPASLLSDPDIKAFVELTNRRYPRPEEGPRLHEQLFARDKTAQEMHEIVRVWLAMNPDRGSERAWLVLNLCDYTSGPSYLKEIKSGYDDRTDGDEMLVRNEAAYAKALTERLEWLELVRRDSSVPADVRGYAAYMRLKEITPRMAKTKAGLDALSEDVEAMVAAGELNQTLQGYVYFTMIFCYSAYGAAAIDDYLAKLAKHSSPAARQKAADEMAKLVKQRAGLDWIKFTAMDGREVDVAKLRGKVVLVDFGATWCVPCIKEIPGMVEAYAKYRDKGFEIIGLSLEDARVADSDTKDQVAAKISRERKKLADLVAKYGITWPVYFETRGLKNEFCARLGITGIPAMFLVDREGKVVSTAARGEALERELRQLLKL